MSPPTVRPVRSNIFAFCHVGLLPTAVPLNSIEKVLDFLEKKYLKIIPQNQIEDSSYNADYKYKQTTLKLDKDFNPVKNEDYKYGFMDKEGYLIIAYKYDCAYDFSEGLAMVYSTRNRIDYYGYIDEKGSEVISLQYEFGESFSQGLALVRQNRKFGFIDKRGVIVLPFKYDDADSFEGGKARVKIKNRQIYIDNTGNEI
ncbi:MAG: WG repeat-containing protein [Bacteroidetes bacterium]|nr:WG repeat-containing protein [Bacteroidota bacterium]